MLQSLLEHHLTSYEGNVKHFFSASGRFPNTLNNIRINNRPIRPLLPNSNKIDITYLLLVMRPDPPRERKNSKFV